MGFLCCSNKPYGLVQVFHTPAVREQMPDLTEAQLVADVGAIKDQRHELGYFFFFFEGKTTHEDGFI